MTFKKGPDPKVEEVVSDTIFLSFPEHYEEKGRGLKASVSFPIFLSLHNRLINKAPK